MTRNEVIAAFNTIRVWQNGDRRAVHKPLLVLLALSRVNDATAQTMDWSDAEPLLKGLLKSSVQMVRPTRGTTLSGIYRQMGYGSCMAQRQCCIALQAQHPH